MRNLFLALALACTVASAEARQGVPQPLHTLDISSLGPPGILIFDGTVAFLNDRTLAVGVCYKSACNVATFRLEQEGLRQIGKLTGTDRFHAIFRSADGEVFLAGIKRRGDRGAILLNPELQMPRWVTSTSRISIFGERVPEGRGLLLAQTGDLAAFLDKEIIRIQRSDGEVLGSFHVPKRRSSPTIRFLDRDRILLDQGDDTQVREFNGAILRTLMKPKHALGEQVRQSANGNYLLYDSFVHRVSLGEAIFEKMRAVLTMGMAGDGDTPDREVVRVINTRTGGECFEWTKSADQFTPFVDHADIAPSGHLVAIITQSALKIFALPDQCGAK